VDGTDSWECLVIWEGVKVTKTGAHKGLGYIVQPIITSPQPSSFDRLRTRPEREGVGSSYLGRVRRQVERVSL
jgi:hypothetical protein